MCLNVKNDDLICSQVTEMHNSKVERLEYSIHNLNHEACLDPSVAAVSARRCVRIRCRVFESVFPLYDCVCLR